MKSDPMIPPAFNLPKLKSRRQELRKKQTDAEKALWQKLRGKQLKNLKFFRQYSIGPFILDFYCPQKYLGVELDGGGHASEEGRAYDEEREQYLKSMNVRIIRFWNHDILKNLDAVLEKILSECSAGS
jgi:very-short-patch-repair endonuclease